MHKIMTFALQTRDEFDQSGDVSGCHKIDAQIHENCFGMQGKMFRLAEVRLLPERGSDSLLELADAAALCYVVRDDSTCLPDQAQGPVCITFPAREGCDAPADRQPGPENLGAQSAPEHFLSRPNGQQQAPRDAFTDIENSSSCVERSTGAGDSFELSSEASCQRTCSDAHHGKVPACSGRMDASSAEDKRTSASIAAVAAGQGGKGKEAAGVSYREQVCLRALEADAGTSAVHGMDPEIERGVLMCLVAECQAVLQQLPTTASQDETLLRSLCSRSATEPASTSKGEYVGQGVAVSNSVSGHHCSKCGSPRVAARAEQNVAGQGNGAGSSSVSGEACSSCEGGEKGADSRGGEGWRERCHLEMAVQYRLQRKLLLARVAADLAAQAALMC